MPKVAIYNVNGEQVGEMDLNDHIFGVPVHRQAMFDVVNMHLAGKRRGTHDTKTRSEVRGGGRKPWRQKGTGRARHGTIRSPIWRGGGIVFGPHPRDYSFRLNKKVRRLAMKSALSSKVEAGSIVVVEGIQMEAPKTRDMIQMLNNLKIDNRALVVTADTDESVFKSARNIPGVKSLSVPGLNVYDLLAHHTLVITRDAVARVEEVFA
ncbi:MAG: 50S ribosomal protein L4 [Firmicutes bacterium]|nr:50S ribosomal protein L4 [Bacillota bacterium]